ncbi:MAG: hypothetical protein NTV34_18275 [Proteobacteria bacterium]|nr:hypothetical protein [Pseudomonadota bacterium]
MDRQRKPCICVRVNQKICAKVQKSRFYYAKIVRFFVAAMIAFGGLNLSSSEVCAAEKPASDSATIKKKSKKRSKKKKPTGAEEVPPDPEATTEGSSSTPPKRFEILVNAGLAPNPFLGIGGTVGIFLGDGSSAIEGSLLTAQKKIDPVSFSATVFGARYRKSFFTVPYIAAGLGLKTLTAKWNTLSVDEQAEFASGGSSTSIILDLAFGGQVKFGSLVLGADAVGVMYPIVKLSKTETKPDEGVYSVDDYAAQKEKFDKQNGLNLVLFRVGLGFAF